MKAIVSLCFVLPALFGTTQAAPPDKNAPQLLIEARLIEVNDEAMDSLAPFAATGATPSISGMLKDDQLSSLWNKIETTKGVDILSMPRVTTCSGQEAKVEMGREFAYAEASGKPATKQLGTLLKVLPRIDGLNDIDLEVSLQIAGLEGIRKDADSGYEQPVFNERKAVTRVTMSSAQTVVFGLPPTLTKQTTVDSSPGGVVTKTKDVKRHTVVFVTANIVAPAACKPLEPSR
jgi:Flp pilus assembly secretin CpaC